MLKMVVYYNRYSQYNGQIARFTGKTVMSGSKYHVISSKFGQCVPVKHVDRIEVYPAEHRDHRFDSDRTSMQFVDYPYNNRIVYHDN